MWVFKILARLLRNEILLKPKGRRARRPVIEFLRQQKFKYRAVEIWLGLAEPDGLCCLVFFWDDAELSRFQSARHLPVISAMFRDSLAKAGYPMNAVSHVDVSIHSEETIKREGGYYPYFK